MSPQKYMANLYYNGRLEQQFSSDHLEKLRLSVRLLLEEMRTGCSVHICDVEQNKIVQSLSYQSAE